MPIALICLLERRMILRPEPPSWPCSGCTRSTGEWKCCSKSLLRTSMKGSPAIHYPLKITSDALAHVLLVEGRCPHQLDGRGSRPSTVFALGSGLQDYH